MANETKVRDHRFSLDAGQAGRLEAYLADHHFPHMSSLLCDWTWETDDRLEITFISERFSQTCTLLESTVLGRTLPALTLADDKAGLGEGRTFNLLENLKPFENVACSLLDPHGNIVHIALSGAPRFADGGIFLGYSGTACNITPLLAFRRHYYDEKRSCDEQPAPTPPQIAPSPRDQGGVEAPLSSPAADPDAFVVYDPHGRIIAASPQYAALYPAVRDLIRPGAALGDILHAAARRLHIGAASESPERWVARKLDERLRPPSGPQEIFRDGRWWRISELVSADGNVISMHTDITERRKHMQKGRESGARYRQLVNLIPDMICTVRGGNITWLNPAGVRMLAVGDAGDVVGKPLNHIVHPDYQIVTDNEFETLSTARDGVPIKMIRADGSFFDVEISLRPYPDGERRHCERPDGEVMIMARDITVHNHTARTLLDREARLRGIMNAVIAGIISIDADGVILSLNAAAEKIFGYGEYEIVGCPAAQLMADAPPKDASKRRRGKKGQTLTLDKTKIMGKNRELIGIRKDGTRFPLELTLSELSRNDSTLLIGVVRDLRARKQAEKALRDSEERYALAIDGAAEGIWDWNLPEDCVYTSDVLRNMLSYKSNRIKSRSWMKTIHPADRERFRRSLLQHLKGKSEIFSIEYRLNSKNMGMRWVRQRGKALRDETGRAYRIAGSLSDVTERVAFQKSLKKAKETAEVANRVKSEFLANMSHELRTPLNAIIGFSDIMCTGLFGKIDARYQDYIQSIHDSGAHLLGLINDILDVSRIEVGKLELNDDIIAPLDAIDAAVGLVRPDADAAKIALVVHIEDGLPPIRVDARRFRQILLNLLSNAVKFTAEGGRVTLTAAIDRTGAFVISIADTGIGMSSDEINLSITPFGQVDSTLSRKYEGTGLGLPLAKNFVEMHGGRFLLDSTPGQGTNVTIMLPTERVIDPQKV
ncbi:PAS domain-containing sensor histidine kinase [Varunaivibrio sulfuroxidans]|uniref:histidine kinase n=1 Tax=Varunaivibrio sulfuroxidans TaxID=1773489 RepID=A0A4R3JFS0_9PROT|nr:PAS domain-containing sensor histidine kinase [Varunaivibrio sulfuroxidans]TCS63530.1 PAS domain S-box-containing protein [Varunaivibrio sulfuroxidans]WES30326.1 PAS domain S-box protein [Varunaivibrio sulfuroxidans]